MYTLRNTLRTRLNWTNSKIFGGCWSRCGWFWLWEEVILQLVVWWRGRVRVWVWGLGSECCQGKVPHIGLSTSVCTGVVYNTVDYFATLCGMSPGIAMLVSPVLKTRQLCTNILDPYESFLVPWSPFLWTPPWHFCLPWTLNPSCQCTSVFFKQEHRIRSFSVKSCVELIRRNEFIYLQPERLEGFCCQL